MKKILSLAVVAAAAACGGPAQDDFGRATPTFESVALEMTAADAVGENFDASATAGATLGLSADPAADAQVDDPCHPHLFLRTHAIVAATNGGIWRVLRPIHRIIPLSPRRRDGKTHVWERVVDGFDYQYSVVKTGDHSFTAQLKVKKVSDPDTSFVTVYDATVQRDPSNHDGSGSATLDLDKLASVTGDAVSGQLTLDFSVTAADKKVVVTMTNFKVNSDLPRNMHFVFFKQTGKGGSLKFIDDMHLGCTGQTPPAAGTTPVTTVARWVVASDGIHFRSDAGATGGQIPGNRKWEGVTCAQGRDPRETFWMMKLEDTTTGQPVSARSSQNTVATAAACDAVFGSVPSIDNATNDYDFGAVDFSSDDPLPFP